MGVNVHTLVHKHVNTHTCVGKHMRTHPDIPERKELEALNRFPETFMILPKFKNTNPHHMLMLTHTLPRQVRQLPETRLTDSHVPEHTVSTNLLL